MKHMYNLNTTKGKNGREEIVKIIMARNFRKLMTDIRSHA